MKLRITELREARGMSQSELANVIGVSPRTEWSWEQGKTFPNVEQAWRLCELFGIDPNTLVGWSGEGTEQRPVSNDESRLLANYRSSLSTDRANLSRMAQLSARAAEEERPEVDRDSLRTLSVDGRIAHPVIPKKDAKTLPL